MHGMARGPDHSRPEARLNPAVERRQKSVEVAGIMESGQEAWPFPCCLRRSPCRNAQEGLGRLEGANAAGGVTLGTIYRKQAWPGVVMHRNRPLAALA
jgi:hypothetical protein